MTNKETQPVETDEQQPKNSGTSAKKQAQPTVEIQRFFADAHQGLDSAQVNERIAQGLVNKVTKKYSKTYRSIFVGNICTFFNLLCALVAFAVHLRTHFFL